MQESAKTAASLKRVPPAGKQHVKFPKERIKRLLMDNSNPAENLLPLGDPLHNEAPREMGVLGV